MAQNQLFRIHIRQKQSNEDKNQCIKNSFSPEHCRHTVIKKTVWPGLLTAFSCYDSLEYTAASHISPSFTKCDTWNNSPCDGLGHLQQDQGWSFLSALLLLSPVQWVGGKCQNSKGPTAKKLLLSWTLSLECLHCVSNPSPCFLVL